MRAGRRTVHGVWAGRQYTLAGWYERSRTGERATGAGPCFALPVNIQHPASTDGASGSLRKIWPPTVPWCNGLETAGDLQHHCIIA
jgi:hypothetical protein